MNITKRLTEGQRTKYLEALKKYNEEGLYRHAIGQGLMALAENPDADLAILDYADAFFILHRRTGEEDYFRIAKALRRAAHVLYRELLRQNKNRKPSDRFLNVVR